MRFERKQMKFLLRRIWPVFPVAGLLLVCAVAMFAPLSCRPSSNLSTTPPASPLRLDGVPTVRVRLTGSPVESMDVGCTGGYRILVDGRDVGRSHLAMNSTPCKRTNGKWILGLLTAPGEKLELDPRTGGFVRVGDTMYRGRLVLLAADENHFYIHNHVDLESYLASVVSKELYPNFHPEAYRAQAIAARTYAIYEMATRGARGSFDVWDSQRSQVYGGMLAETDRSWQAVRDTHACVLAYGSPGNERVFLTQFSACNGGYVNGAHVIRNLPPGQRIAPLAGGQKDGDGRACPRYSWAPVRVGKADLFAALANRYDAVRALGGIETLRVKEQTTYGRPIWLEAKGPNGRTATIRAEDVRLCLLRSGPPEAKKLYSMNCQVRDAGDAIEFHDGKGFGHGVGMSQWGAEEKARRGARAEDILQFYYPGAVIFRAY
ncbi:MAG: SpoIID/LytB domain-containing protein [Phycisphaerae bacterium]|nr:SpoIID/LytB domain-containing protein [Phycisphaerae bacterium]